MEIMGGIFTRRDYFWKRTASWDWFGTLRWWEVSVEFLGLNGTGGAWLKEKWRWNGSEQVMHATIRTLSFEDTEKLISEIRAKLPPAREEHPGIAEPNPTC